MVTVFFPGYSQTCMSPEPDQNTCCMLCAASWPGRLLLDSKAASGRHQDLSSGCTSALCSSLNTIAVVIGLSGIDNRAASTHALRHACCTGLPNLTAHCSQHHVQLLLGALQLRDDQS